MYITAVCLTCRSWHQERRCKQRSIDVRWPGLSAAMLQQTMVSCDASSAFIFFGNTLVQCISCWSIRRSATTHYPMLNGFNAVVCFQGWRLLTSTGYQLVQGRLNCTSCLEPPKSSLFAYGWLLFQSFPGCCFGRLVCLVAFTYYTDADARSRSCLHGVSIKSADVQLVNTIALWSWRSFW